MNSTQYVFKPKPEMADWIDENISSWTVFCYESIYKKQKKQYNDSYKRVANTVAYVLVGCILLSLTYVFPLLSVSYIVFLMVGITFVIIGSISFFLEVLPHGRRRTR